MISSAQSRQAAPPLRLRLKVLEWFVFFEAGGCSLVSSVRGVVCESAGELWLVFTSRSGAQRWLPTWLPTNCRRDAERLLESVEETARRLLKEPGVCRG